MSAMSSQSTACPQCQYTSAQMDANNRFCPQCRFPLMIVANKYRLLRLLAEGGFGNVYLAHHIHLIEDNARVIKVIRPEVMNQPGMETRFFREVRITASLSQRNEHIVRIYDDFGEEPQLGFYYVMEYLEGHSLYQLINGPFDVQQALNIFDQLCDAMIEAHRSSIIHRDLKPDNIVLIQRRQKQDFVKVLDFGIAKPLKGGNVQTQLTQGALGTPFYMSPEQCLAKDVSPESDIYAMAIIFYELLTGTLPYNFEADAELFAILHAHITAPPNPLSLHRAGLPEGLEAVILKALSKKPEERYPSVEMLRDAIRPFIDHSASYAALTTSSHLRSTSPLTHTPPPSKESESQESPGTQSVSLPTSQKIASPSDNVAPVHAGDAGLPSARLPTPTPAPASHHKMPTSGTREWKRDQDLEELSPRTSHESLTGNNPAPETPTPIISYDTPEPSKNFEDGVTTPSPRLIDTRLQELEKQPQKRSNSGFLVFLLGLFIALSGGGGWYWFQQTQSSKQTVQSGTKKRLAHNDKTPTNSIPDAGNTAQNAPDQFAPLGSTPPIEPPVNEPPVDSVHPVLHRKPVRRRRVRRRSRRKRKHHFRHRPRRRPRRRPIKRRVIKRRVTPPVRTIIPPIRRRAIVRRTPPRVVALAPQPKGATPAEKTALANYNVAGKELQYLFKNRRDGRAIFRQSRRVKRLYRRLTRRQKQMQSTHRYQSIIYLQRVRYFRAKFKKLSWMPNPYTTQRAEFNRINKKYRYYIRQIGMMYRFPKSPYYGCALALTGEAQELVAHLYKDALYSPLPPPGFRHDPISQGTFRRKAQMLFKDAKRTYRNGLRKLHSLKRNFFCIKNIRKGIQRTSRY